MTQAPQKNSSRIFGIILCAVGIILLIVIAVVGLIYRSNFSGDSNVYSTSQEIWGQFGDYFGGTLNPIFGFASLAVLLYTLSVQKEELDETKKAFKAQIDLMEQQAFETTFFHLIKLFLEYQEKLHDQKTSKPNTLRKSIEEAYNRVTLKDFPERIDDLKDGFEEHKPLARVSYTILSHIANSTQNTKYMDIFMNQWNIENLGEIALFFTYCFRESADAEVRNEFDDTEKLKLFIKCAIPRIKKSDRETCKAVLDQISQTSAQ